MFLALVKTASQKYRDKLTRILQVGNGKDIYLILLYLRNIEQSPNKYLAVKLKMHCSMVRTSGLQLCGCEIDPETGLSIIFLEQGI